MYELSLLFSDALVIIVENECAPRMALRGRQAVQWNRTSSEKSQSDVQPGCTARENLQTVQSNRTTQQNVQYVY